MLQHLKQTKTRNGIILSSCESREILITMRIIHIATQIHRIIYDNQD